MVVNLDSLLQGSKLLRTLEIIEVTVQELSSSGDKGDSKYVDFFSPSSNFLRAELKVWKIIIVQKFAVMVTIGNTCFSKLRTVHQPKDSSLVIKEDMGEY